MEVESRPVTLINQWVNFTEYNEEHASFAHLNKGFSFFEWCIILYYIVILVGKKTKTLLAIIRFFCNNYRDFILRQGRVEQKTLFVNPSDRNCVSCVDDV